MSMTDPIADMLTRIRNAQKARKESVSVALRRFSDACIDAVSK
jgi:ribosomal protein S8